MLSFSGIYFFTCFFFQSWFIVRCFASVSLVTYIRMWPLFAPRSPLVVYLLTWPLFAPRSLPGATIFEAVQLLMFKHAQQTGGYIPRTSTGWERVTACWLDNPDTVFISCRIFRFFRGFGFGFGFVVFLVVFSLWVFAHKYFWFCLWFCCFCRLGFAHMTSSLSMYVVACDHGTRGSLYRSYLLVGGIDEHGVRMYNWMVIRVGR